MSITNTDLNPLAVWVHQAQEAFPNTPSLSHLRQTIEEGRTPDPQEVHEALQAISGALQTSGQELMRRVGLWVDPQRERETHFDHLAASQVLAHLDQPQNDRGLIVSPIRLREMMESIIHRLVFRSHSSPRVEALAQKEILLVVHGIENRERWSSRLASLLGIPESARFSDREIWEQNGVRIRLTSIHQLTRLPRADLKRVLDAVGLILVDREHHIRPVVEDPRDPDHCRFARILVEGGFLTRDFKILQNSSRVYFGFTETTAPAADRVYGGPNALAFGTDLPALVSQGFVKKPDVRAVVPQGFLPDTSVPLAWQSLSVGDRVKNIIDIIQTLTQELGERDTKPRFAVYTGSREEALRLTLALERLSSYRNRVAMLISGDQPFIKGRRRRDWQDFLSGTRDILVHVQTMLEGVDEFQRNPVDVAIFSNAEMAGSYRFALHGIIPHMISRERPALFVDQAGIFLSHPDLVFIDTTVHLFGPGELKKASVSSGRHFPRSPVLPLQGTDIFVIDFFGQQVGKRVARFLAKIQGRQTRTQIAMTMGWSDELVEHLIQGSYLPNSRQVMESLAKAHGLAVFETDYLINCWAMDRLDYYEQHFPIPSSLAENEQELLRMVRFGLIRNKNGQVSRVKGIRSDTFRKYLERGEWPQNVGKQRHQFVQGLALVIGSTNHPSMGKAFLRNYLGESYTGDYWQPENIDDLRSIKLSQIATWFEMVEKEKGRPLEEIVWQFRKIGKMGIVNPAPQPMEAANPISYYARLKIRRNHSRSYTIFSAMGSGAEKAIGALRQSALANRGFLSIRSDGFLGLRKFGHLRVEDFDDLQPRDIHEWFLSVEQKIGTRSQKIFLQWAMSHVSLLEGGPFFSDMHPVLEDELKNGEGDGWLRLIEDEPGKYTVLEAKGGQSAKQFIEKLRQFSSKHPDVLWIHPSDGFLSLRALTLDDLRHLSLRDFQTWFDSVEKESGARPKDITWQFTYEYTVGRINAPVPLKVTDEDGRRQYGRVRFLEIEKGKKYEITKGAGQGAGDVINTLRAHPLNGTALLIRPNFLLFENEPPTLSDFAVLKWVDIESIFRAVADFEGRDFRDLEKIALHYLLDEEVLYHVGVASDFRYATESRPGEIVISKKPAFALAEEDPDNGIYGYFTPEELAPMVSYRVECISGRGATQVEDAIARSPIGDKLLQGALIQDRRHITRSRVIIPVVLPAPDPYWKPKTEEELKNGTKEQIESWFRFLAQGPFSIPKEIYFRFSWDHERQHFINPTPVRQKDNINERIHGYLKILRSNDGSFEIAEAGGQHGTASVDVLRQSTLVQTRALHLDPNGFVFRSVALKITDLEHLTLSRIQQWFEQVAKDEGISEDFVNEIVWQYKREDKHDLVGHWPVLKNKEDDKTKGGYGRFFIRKINREIYDIFRAEGELGRDVVSALKKTTLYQEHRLQIWSDGFLFPKESLRLRDLHHLKPVILKEWFEEVAGQEDKTFEEVDEINWHMGFAKSRDGAITPSQVSSSEKSPAFKGRQATLRIKKLSLGHYAIVNQSGGRAITKPILDALRRAPITQGDNPHLQILLPSSPPPSSPRGPIRLVELPPAELAQVGLATNSHSENHGNTNLAESQPDHILSQESHGENATLFPFPATGIPFQGVQTFLRVVG